MKLCFIKYIGTESDGFNRYEFIFTNNIKDVVINSINYFPACLSDDIQISSNDIIIENVITKIKFDLIQENCCFSFLHAKIGCVALAWENIDLYDSYPDNRGRLFFFFGDDYQTVEERLAKCGIIML